MSKVAIASKGPALAMALALGVFGLRVVSAAELDVGPGQPFSDINAAVEKAAPGDTILVHPLANGQPYEKVALLIRKPSLTIQAEQGQTVKLSGAGFDYS